MLPDLFLSGSFQYIDMILVDFHERLMTTPQQRLKTKALWAVMTNLAYLTKDVKMVDFSDEAFNLSEEPYPQCGSGLLKDPKQESSPPETPKGFSTPSPERSRTSPPPPSEASLAPPSEASLAPLTQASPTPPVEDSPKDSPSESSQLPDSPEEDVTD